MLTATEAKLVSYRSRDYYNIVENKILDATNKGETSCDIKMSEIPNGTHGILCEITYLLNELGYQTLINENIISVFWNVQKPFLYELDTFEEANEEYDSYEW